MNFTPQSLNQISTARSPTTAEFFSKVYVNENSVVQDACEEERHVDYISGQYDCSTVNQGQLSFEPARPLAPDLWTRSMYLSNFNVEARLLAVPGVQQFYLTYPTIAQFNLAQTQLTVHCTVKWNLRIFSFSRLQIIFCKTKKFFFAYLQMIQSTYFCK